MSLRRLKAELRVPISGFVVDARLVSARLVVGPSHTFGYEGFDVRVALPPTAHLPPHFRQKGTQVQGVDDRGNVVWRAARFKSVDSLVDEVLAYSPVRVVVTVEQAVPDDQLPNPEQWDTEEIAEVGTPIEQLQYTFSKACRDAFEYWLRVLRWQLGDAFLGRPVYPPDRHDPALVDVASDEVVSGDAFMLDFGDDENSAIGPEEWQGVQESLDAGRTPPLPLEYYFDGLVQMKIGDIRRAVLDLAIAAEVHLKLEVTRALPHGLHPSIVEAVQRLAIRAYQDKLFPGQLSPADQLRYRKLKTGLQGLADSRNVIVHNGAVTTTMEECRAYAEAVREVLGLRVLPADGVDLGAAGLLSL